MTRFHDQARAACIALLGPGVIFLLMGVREPGWVVPGAALMALGLAALARPSRG